MIHGTMKYKKSGMSTAAILLSMCFKKSENVLRQIMSECVY
jgi:hypothetical protein